MATFKCRVADENGRIGAIERSAASPETAARELAAEGFYVLAVDPDAKEQSVGRVRPALVREFTDSLSTLLRAGLTVSDALGVQQSIFDTGEGAALISHLLSRVERGDPLSSALAELGGGFSGVYCGLVRIGERIGTMSHVLTRMSTYLRKKKQIRDKLLGSLTYPAVVLLVAAGGFVLIATIVLPQMRSIFAELGASVPPAAVTLTRSTSVLGKAIGALFGLVGATPAILLARRTRWASAIDRMLLRLPILGSMLIRREMLNYVFAMETLSESGIPVETALREGAAVFQNHALAAGARRIADRVSDGVALSAALDEAEPFPPRLAIWARIGERTGNAGSIFGQLRGYYEEEMNRWIDRFMTLVEPALIVAVGIVMLVFVVTFVAPLFQVFGSVL